MIGATAMRASWLLSQAEQVGLVVDRSGVEGNVVEVYPGAALRQWGLPYSGYKSGRSAGDQRQRVLAKLIEGMGLTVTTDVTNDHQLDALICAVVARMARTGRTYPIPEEHRESAQLEGWIHMPVAPLVAD